MTLYASLQKFNRQELVQAFVLGVISFAQPGIWIALQIIGAGGLQTVGTANTANAILFLLMTITSPFSAVLINKIGIRWCIALGCLGFPFYSAGLYLNSKNGTQWFIKFGAVLTGLSAQLFWIGEGTAAVYYPGENERSLYIGIWQFVNKFGLIIAGSISLSLNINSSHAGSLSLNTYIAFITINAVGCFLPWFMVKPEDVIRRDGTVAKSNITTESYKQGFQRVWNVYKRREVYLLAPISLAAMWYFTYQSNFTASYFSVRVRSLNTLVVAIVQMAADIIVGLILDLRRWTTKTKLRWSWHLININMIGYFIYSFILQGIYDRNHQKALDWTDSGFARAFVPNLLFRFGQEALLVWIYWVIGELNLHRSDLTYVVSAVRGVETFGEMWAFVVGATSSSNMVNLAVSGGIYFAVVPLVTYLIHNVVEDVAAKNEVRNQELDAEIESSDIDIEKTVSEDDKEAGVTSHTKEIESN